MTFAMWWAEQYGKFGWGFIGGNDSIIYFADCIHKGITKDDMRQFMIKRSKND